MLGRRKPSRELQRLKRSVEDLLAAQPDDLRLRDHLEGLARDERFDGLTWLWGPRLYARNRVVFGPFIRHHFSPWQADKRRWRRVRWEDHSEELADWLAAAREHRDSYLVRELLAWRYAGKGWGVDHKSLVGSDTRCLSLRGERRRARDCARRVRALVHSR